MVVAEDDRMEEQVFDFVRKAEEASLAAGRNSRKASVTFCLLRS